MVSVGQSLFNDSAAGEFLDNIYNLARLSVTASLYFASVSQPYGNGWKKTEG